MEGVRINTLGAMNEFANLRELDESLPIQTRMEIHLLLTMRNIVLFSTGWVPFTFRKL
jgi:hypothetical protein